MKDKIVTDEVVEQIAEQPAVMTREQVEAEIARLQWVISRDDEHVEEHHVALENLYGLRDKMDALENE